MAFQGTPVVTVISDRIVRITGVWIAASGQGIAAQPAAAGGGMVLPFVGLPVTWNPEPYTDPDGNVITILESVKVWWVPTTVGGAGAPEQLPTVTIDKSLATNGAFIVEFNNLDTVNDTPGMEIYIETH